jgi:hypothetical protein
VGWVVNATPRPLYPRERPGTHCIGGWADLRAGQDGAKILASTGIRSPDRPARSESLYRLSYRGPQSWFSPEIINSWDHETCWGLVCLFVRGVSPFRQLVCLSVRGVSPFRQFVCLSVRGVSPFGQFVCLSVRGVSPLQSIISNKPAPDRSVEIKTKLPAVFEHSTAARCHYIWFNSLHSILPFPQRHTEVLPVCRLEAALQYPN